MKNAALSCRFLIATPVLFAMGACLVYFFFTPMVMWFFLSMQQTGKDGQAIIELLPSVSEYLSLIMTLIFAFGLVFQLPVVGDASGASGDHLGGGSWRAKRKWAIVLAFIAAAVLTPPDPMSQIGLALPTILLYEVSIFAAKMIERKRAQQLREKEAQGES